MEFDGNVRVGRWNIPVERPQTDWRWVGLGILVATAMAGWAGFICTLGSPFLTLITLIPIVAAARAVGLRFAGQRRADRHPALVWSKAAWEPLSSDVTQYEVCMDVVFGRAVVGRDQGRLWFEPEALCFVGDHTSFALTSDLIDFIHVTRFKKPALPFERSLFVPIAGCPWSVQFDVTDRMKEQAYARLDRSITRLSFMPYSDEIRQLPPMAMGPGAASIAELFRASVTEMTALAFWFFAAFCFGVLSVDGMVGVDSLALVFMITVVLLGFRTTTCVRRLKALASVGRDLGRLRRMSRSK